MMFRSTFVLGIVALFGVSAFQVRNPTSLQKSWRTTTTSSTRLFSTTSNDPLTVKAALPSTLIDAEGNVIESAETLASLVGNKRVALYFAAGWCPDCRNLDFMLPQYCKALSDSNQPIQLIYVPSDNTMEEQLTRMRELEIEMGVPLGEAADALKKQYGVWPDAEIDKFGGFVREWIDYDDMQEDAGEGMVDGDIQDAELADDMAVDGVELMEEYPEDDSGRRSGIPAFVVLDNQGAEFVFLNTEADSIMALAEWPVDDPQGIW